MSGRLVILALLLSACARQSENVIPEALSFSPAVAPAPIVTGNPAEAAMAVYFTVTNQGSEPDSLLEVTSPISQRASLHEQMVHDGSAMMIPASGRVAPHEQLILQPGGLHLMLEGLSHVPAPGDSLTLTLRFRHAGQVTVHAEVVSYSALEAALSRRDAKP